MTCCLDSAPYSTIRTAESFRRALIDAMESDDDIEIILGKCTDVDLSFVQLVYVAREHARYSGKRLRLRQPAPAPVAALLERAGFLSAASPQDLDFWFHGERPQ